MLIAPSSALPPTPSLPSPSLFALWLLDPPPCTSSLGEHPEWSSYSQALSSSLLFSWRPSLPRCRLLLPSLLTCTAWPGSSSSCCSSSSPPPLSPSSSSPHVAQILNRDKGWLVGPGHSLLCVLLGIESRVLCMPDKHWSSSVIPLAVFSFPCVHVYGGRGFVLYFE